MFSQVSTFGEHSIWNYDTIVHPFRSYIEKIFETSDIEYLKLSEEMSVKENLHDIESLFHKKFYTAIKSNDEFKKIYCDFIVEVYKHFFPDEKIIIYQSFPSIRFQFHNNISVPIHCDSDSLGNHPLGEKNVLIPITKMRNTNRLFIESSPQAGDFTGLDLDVGQFLYFNGNTCRHHNEKNTEDWIRISLDFRCILAKDYMNYIDSNTIVSTNPRDPEKSRAPTKMIIGGYYQIHFLNESSEKMLNWHFQKDMLLQSQPNFDIQEADACYEYLKSGTNFITEFKKTEELEKMICQYTKSSYCYMTTSGNLAIVLALLALDLQPGDEVIVPNYTMIATINSVKLLGLSPVIIDVDETTYTMNLETIQNAITSKTKAVLHVSLNNRQSNIKGIARFCKQNSLWLIEDAAQSLGCFLEDQHFGTFGDIGCFSLSTPKIISTGQGGFCITNNEILGNKMRMIKNFGRKSGGVDIFEVFGINMKFTDIQAVIGIEQMKKLPERVNRLKDIFILYYNSLKEYNIMKPYDYDGWIPWFIDIFLPNRDQLMLFLKNHNIQTRVTYPEINKTPMYYDTNTFKISNYISTNGLFLPTHTCLKDTEIVHICNLIKFFMKTIS